MNQEDYIKTEAELKCVECGVYIFQCSNCTHYFADDEPLYCGVDDIHICEGCYKLCAKKGE